jgi:predicted transcriptional regulator of viral defense system
MNRGDALETLLEAANEQGGYVSAAQATRLGVERRDIERLIASGDLQRVRRGVYRMRHAQSHFEDDIAAWLHLQRDVLPWENPPRAVLSHDSAAAIHRLGTIIPTRPSLTVLRGARTTELDDIELHRDRLGDADWAWEHADNLRLPVTTPARTIVDLILAKQEPSYVDRAVREALVRHLISPQQLADAARGRKRRTASLQARVSALLEDAA